MGDALFETDREQVAQVAAGVRRTLGNG
jgi:hypothetical protein